MKPFFDYYSNLLDMRKAITKAWFGHDGAYYRENIEPTGAERDCDHGGRPPQTHPPGRPGRQAAAGARPGAGDLVGRGQPGPRCGRPAVLPRRAAGDEGRDGRR